MLKDLESVLAAAAIATATLAAPACGDSGTESTSDDPTAGSEAGCPGTSAGCPGTSAGCPGTSAGCPGSVLPTNEAELLPWLEAGNYSGWAAEPDIHDQTGSSPHGRVKIFVNATLKDSLEAGNATHPIDSASVKELYDADDAPIGWAVSLKTAADSDMGNGWYWFEWVDTMDPKTVADGNGEGLCTGCHSTGMDYVLTPFWSP